MAKKKDKFPAYAVTTPQHLQFSDKPSTEKGKKKRKRKLQGNNKNANK
jgi:hypothetical protein